MLFYGESYMKNVVSQGTLIVNLTSYDESIPRLDLLLPPRELGRYLDDNFDNAYYNYIFSNNEVFYQFFSIIYNLYCGADILITADSSEWSEMLIEALMKLIQQRYGYNGVCIRSLEDYIHAKNSNVNEFTGMGLTNMDMDRARYTYLMEQYRLRSGAKEIIYDETGKQTYLED